MSEEIGSDGSKPPPRGLLGRLPHGEMLRYLIVGAWNTLFGYGCFFILLRLFLKTLPAHPSISASLASITATVVNVTVSFLGYKWFVFRTRGNYGREYGRSMIVYLPSLVLNAAAIAPLTTALRAVPSFTKWAPYLAGALLAVVTVMISFFGHKHISFKKSTMAGSESREP